jgi:hypothetical protein
VFTLGQAAKAVGRSKSALSRDIKAGRVSAGRNPDGSPAIDDSELCRVFSPVSRDNGLRDDPQPLGNGAGTTERVHETPAQRFADSLELRERLARAETERDLLRELVADLRAMRNAEVEERRRLLAMLTDQRSRPWWRRWFR